MAYDKFEKFQRSPDMDIKEYINEFESLYDKIRAHNMELPDGVLAYRVLKNANISQEHEQLARATITEFSFSNITEQLKKNFGDVATTQNSVTAAVKADPTFQVENKEDAFYGNYAKSQTRGRWKSRNPYRGAFCGGCYKSNESRTSVGNKNPLDSSENVSRCSICESIYHWKRDCPDTYENQQKDDSKINLPVVEDTHFVEHIEVTLFQPPDLKNSEMKNFVGETLCCAVLDSGCTRTVCGKVWLNCYLDTLSDDEKNASRKSRVKRFLSLVMALQ